MAQYHYVLGYDTVSMRWFVESDTTAYFSDGNVWDEEQYRKEFWGWRVPDGDSEDALDIDLLNTLYSLVDIIPIPKEHEDAIA
jgi:hypothetical protein